MDSEENVRMNQDQEPELELDPVSERRVTEALNSLDTVEPPAGFTGRVMWRTRHLTLARQAGRSGARRNGDGLDLAKKVLMGLVGIAAAALLVAYVNGVPFTTGAGTEGTIGAAQRYQAEQNTKDLVKIEDPALQAFMQTDAFDTLMHDTQAMAALASPEFQQALANPAVAAALADATVRQALASPAVQQALATPSISNALGAPAVLQVLASPAFQAALGARGVQEALASPELTQALASAGFQQGLASATFQQALAWPAFQQALVAPALQGALTSPGFDRAMAALQQALASPGFQAAMANPQFARGLAARGFIDTLRAHGLAASSIPAAGTSRQP